MVYGIGDSSGVDSKEITINGKSTKEYNTWRGIIRRCGQYNKNSKKHPEYLDVAICDEWKSYKNFLSWIKNEPNYFRWKNGGKNWTIDKDIINKGNKIYCPENCCLVPNRVNVLFTNRRFHRGDVEAPGVNYAKWENKYRAHVNNPLTQKITQLGSFNTIEEAFNVYKKAKEGIIKSVANIEFLLGNISKKCYLGMFNYQIEITD